MQITRIEGRVAQVLNGRQLVINRGEVDGVREGMNFEVRGSQSLTITDPETNQVLDELDRVKVRVQAVEVRERISICSTYEQFEVPTLTSSRINELLSSSRKRYARIQVEPSEYGPAVDPEESYVRRGDRAVQIVEPASN